jgi:lysozyme
VLLVPVIFMAVTLAMSCTGKPEPNDRRTTGASPVKKIHGIDVSHHSGAVDWTKVKAHGHTFAFAKATEGMDDPDPTFAAHWPAMKKAGLIRGAYHFYVTEDDPKEQAKFFIQTVTLKKGDLAPVVDIEILGKDTQPGLVSRFQTFLEILEKHYGIKPIIYTDRGFWNAHLDDKFGSYPLWVAEYDVESPTLPRGWTTYHLWQWKGDAQVPGVEKTADLSKFNHKKKDFSQLMLK